MPKNSEIKKVLLLGAGPVVIGHGTEYDYAVLQSARMLNEEGCRVIIANSNPASLAADPQAADKVYPAPLTVDSIRQIIAAEKPDAIFAGFGGQITLNLLAQLKNEPCLKDILLDVSCELLERTQNRDRFRELLSGLGLPQTPGGAVRTTREGLELGQSIGFPLMVHPSYSVAGLGSAVVYNLEELEDALIRGFDLSPLKQLVLEKALCGWEETEWELLRDSQGETTWVGVTAKTEPAGVHSGNSITYITPGAFAGEKQAAIRPLVESVLEALDITGSLNLKIAGDPATGEVRLLDLNPRFTFNTALVSEVLGIKIAALSAKLALGYTLAEIGGAGGACDSAVAVKMPFFDFKRFSSGDGTLGPSVQAVGETLSFGENFKQALQKGVRSLGAARPGIGADGFNKDPETLTLRHLKEKLLNPNEERLFYIYYALQRGMTLDEVGRHTHIGLPVLKDLAELAVMEKELNTYALYNLPAEVLLRAKQWGYSDRQLATIFRVSEEELRKKRHQLEIHPVCRPIGHKTEPNRGCFIGYDKWYGSPENSSERPTVLLVGSNVLNPDTSAEWAIVHAARALKELGYRTILACSRGLVQLETMVFDRVYLEPITHEVILDIVEMEAVDQVILQFGGSDSLELTGRLQESGITILGTALEDLVEIQEPEKFKRLLERLRIPAILTSGGADREQLADAVGIVVDCIGDGAECRIAGIMEQIETAEIHPGDSALSLPPYSLEQEVIKRAVTIAETLIKTLGIRGWASFRFAVKHDMVYLIQLEPWTSPTIAFVSKATGTDWAGVSARVLIGQALKEQSLSDAPLKHTAVKEAVFSFARFPGIDTVLGSIKRSSGMVMGIDDDFGIAFIKSQLAAGEDLPVAGKVYLSIRNEDKRAFISIAEQLVELGFEVVASDETAAILKRNNIQCEAVFGVGEGRPNILDLMKNGQIQWVINTPSESSNKKGEQLIRSTAVLRGIPVITTLSGALAAVNGLKQYIRTGISIRPLGSYFKG